MPGPMAFDSEHEPIYGTKVKYLNARSIWTCDGRRIVNPHARQRRPMTKSVPPVAFRKPADVCHSPAPSRGFRGVRTSTARSGPCRAVPDRAGKCRRVSRAEMCRPLSADYGTCRLEPERAVRCHRVRPHGRRAPGVLDRHSPTESGIDRHATAPRGIARYRATQSGTARTEPNDPGFVAGSRGRAAHDAAPNGTIRTMTTAIDSRRHTLTPTGTPYPRGTAPSRRCHLGSRPPRRGLWTAASGSTSRGAPRAGSRRRLFLAEHVPGVVETPSASAEQMGGVNEG